MDLRIRPDRGFTLPAAEFRQAATISGYVVPAVRGRADGTIRTARGTLTVSNVPAYHDHNWGTWRDVTWEWGEASTAAGALVYGDIHLPRTQAVENGGQLATLFLWSAHADVRAAAGPETSLRTERGGLVAVLPIAKIAYTGWRPGPVVAGRRVRTPAEVSISAENGPDRVVVHIRVWDALGSLPPSPPTSAAAPVFLQLRGEAVLRGMIGGVPIVWQGPAASETFVRP